jgi:hypothetical protein
MADVYLGRLTGKIRDSVPAGPAGIDPPCEVEVEVLSGEFTSTSIPAHVTSSTGSPMPWYAAAIYFFGTLDVVVGTTIIDGVELRTYEVDTIHSREPGALVIRLYRDHTGVTCVEIPTSAVFNAVVLGLGGGGPGAVYPKNSFASNNTRGPGVVFPGRYARLAFIAPDGSMYGDKGENVGGDLNGKRVPLGYYPEAFTPDGTGFPEGDPVIVDGWNDYHAPPLQVWSPVVAMIHHVDTGSDDHLAVWAIKPSGTPSAHILHLKSAAGAANRVLGVAHIVQPAIITRRTDVTPARWELACCDAPEGEFSNVSVRSPSQEVGVALWSDGDDTDGNVAVVVSGRFWINPVTHLLTDHTTYFLDPRAYYDEAPDADNSPGMWTSQQPGNAVMTRPIFRHYTKGWCVMVEPSVEHAMAWRYGETEAQSNIAEITFDWFYYNDPSNNTALLRFRDRPGVMPNPAELPSGEKGDADASLGQAPEAWDVMAWFTSELYERRAFVMKRLDLIIAGNPDQTTIPDIDFSLPERPGQLVFYMDYNEDARIGDSYDFFAIQDSCLSWIPVSGGNNFGPGGPGVVIGGVLTVRDGYNTVMKWYTCPDFGPNSPAGAEQYNKRYRKVVWDIATEYQAHDWAWRYRPDPSFPDTFEDALLLNHDQDLMPILNANPNAKDALPLKFREIEICDSSDDSVKKIIVLCSEMYE